MVKVLQQPGKGSTKKKATEAGRRAGGTLAEPHPLTTTTTSTPLPHPCPPAQQQPWRQQPVCWWGSWCWREQADRIPKELWLLVASGRTHTKDLPSFLITQNSLEAERWLHEQCLSNQLASMPGGKYQLWHTRYPKEPKTKICEVRCFAEWDFQIYHSLLSARRVWAYSWGDTSSDSTQEGPLDSPLAPPPGLTKQEVEVKVEL